MANPKKHQPLQQRAKLLLQCCFCGFPQIAKGMIAKGIVPFSPSPSAPLQPSSPSALPQTIDTPSTACGGGRSKLTR